MGPFLGRLEIFYGQNQLCGVQERNPRPRGCGKGSHLGRACLHVQAGIQAGSGSLPPLPSTCLPRCSVAVGGCPLLGLLLHPPLVLRELHRCPQPPPGRPLQLHWPASQERTQKHAEWRDRCRRRAWRPQGPGRPPCPGRPHRSPAEWEDQSCALWHSAVAPPADQSCGVPRPTRKRKKRQGSSRPQQLCPLWSSVWGARLKRCRGCQAPPPADSKAWRSPGRCPRWHPGWNRLAQRSEGGCAPSGPLAAPQSVSAANCPAQHLEGALPHGMLRRSESAGAGHLEHSPRPTVKGPGETIDG